MPTSADPLAHEPRPRVFRCCICTRPIHPPGSHVGLVGIAVMRQRHPYAPGRVQRISSERYPARVHKACATWWTQRVRIPGERQREREA